ncbi:hypothetical protein LY76DRAFT_237245 [Colletotrichum caudatum]|nr:hypothetical protein LY76DRAFT_237245 [Colletotrichum caudatum]
MAVTGPHLVARVKKGNVPFAGTTVSGNGGAAGASALGCRAGTCTATRGGIGASIKLLQNLVIWTRLIGNCTKHPPQGFRPMGTPSPARRSSHARLHCGRTMTPAGIPLFPTVVFVLLAVDKWASRKLDGTYAHARRPGDPVPHVRKCGFELTSVTDQGSSPAFWRGSASSSRSSKRRLGKSWSRFPLSRP